MHGKWVKYLLVEARRVNGCCGILQGSTVNPNHCWGLPLLRMIFLFFLWAVLVSEKSVRACGKRLVVWGRVESGRFSEGLGDFLVPALL